MTDCIKKRAGLMDPVIVRPADDEKYEVLCSYNRIKALEMLGYEVIHVNIRDGLSDEDAIELYYGNSCNQQFQLKLSTKIRCYKVL